MAGTDAACDTGGDASDMKKLLEKPGNDRQVKVLNRDGPLATIQVRGKEKQVCKRSLFILSVDNWFRQQVLSLVEWRWLDRFILLCIVVNSILLGIKQHRAQEEEDHYSLNEFIDGPADNVLWAIFSLESVLKILAWGLIFDKKSYLRDPWNVLDFVVVVSGLIERAGAGGSLNFLRLFRLLRPLRSLNAVPQMKILVNTTLSSILKLGNVIILGAFLFMVFGIVGISLMNGIFYHRCHTTENPMLIGGCWSWNVTDEDRLCGGNYNCAPNSFCGGHEKDTDASFRPVFPGGKQGFPWCEGSEPQKLFPETDFVHFDHIGAAFLLIFQVMTLEGWTDLMYMVEDAFSPWFAIIFFVVIVVFTNFFMLNVALAVVDEVQDEFREQADQEAKAEDDANDAGSEGAKAEDDAGLWLDCGLVRCCDSIAKNEIFAGFILVIIGGNVANMCLGWFSLSDAFGYAGLAQAIDILEIIFLGIFVVEMIIMIIAKSPIGYIRDPITCFDGFVVLISVIELIINKTSDGGGGGLSALRTFRLFRVMNKLANKWSKLKVLLKAMLHTGAALNYWLILFVLVLYIFTLMWMSIFAKQFHFEDADALAPLVPKQYHGEEWCPETKGKSWHFRQDCIPRAHFDTFTWGFVTVFQVMTGENWNTIMYAGMRASERWEGTLVPPTVLSAALFVIMILFGQTLFLSLFLSMLISKFDEVQDQFEDEERVKRAMSGKGRSPSQINQATKFLARLASRTNAVEGLERPVKPGDGEEEDISQRPSRQISLQQVPGAACGVDTLPGQLPDSPHTGESSTVTELKRPARSEREDLDDEEEQEAKTQLKKKWPHGYALFILNEANPIRIGARWLLTVKLRDTNIQVFDNFILVCIILSTLCMMADTPLSDPRDISTKFIRTADSVFAVIFIAEMLVKLAALGLVWGPKTYLKSGWNWLDGIVVMVSIVDFASPGGGPGFLRVLRILRTFRPLRVISRNEGLRVVVQTLFQSMGDLLALVSVSLLFLLIFALVFLMYLKGALYMCDAGDADIGYLGEYFGKLGDDWTTPMCLGADSVTGVPASLPRGTFVGSTEEWDGANAACAPDTPMPWQRASADTPICLARCNPSLDAHPPGMENLCHRRYRIPEELPSLCSDPGRQPEHSTPDQEAVGFQYIEDMQRTLTLPCGGSMVDPSTGQVISDAEPFSCRSKFCQDTSSPSDSCKSECEDHQYFCKDVCKQGQGGPECEACRRECEAACMCEDFCTPLVKDAALCHEQGGSWVPVLSQNFDNVINSMLTLFEISTTEGWVDVMYAAGDATDLYRQPLRDNMHGPYVLLFPLWILLSFMFLINLAVGVIVDNFDRAMEGKERNKQTVSEQQQRWIHARLVLHKRAFHFDLTNLHLLSPFRRKVYRLVSSKPFEQTIMASIVINTLIMALRIFPGPTDWWESFHETTNYVFAAIYTIEAILKLIALRGNYWLDRWNRFDFVCVVATLVGIVMKMPGIDYDLGAATSVIRILRIARLFRLLRFLRELNRLFMCLFISIPKLFNVMMILLLFLVLFSILGMSLFGTAKFPDDGTLGVHGNFQTFFRSFVTLFRASTGEAWNEVMHDLAKDEEAYFREGDWCTPQTLFKSRVESTFVVLEEKCLISQPNACPGSWNPLPAIYWVSYTLLITFMILNLVVAVILKGYEEGKEDSDTDTVDLCIEVWKKYDPDCKQKLPLGRAFGFVREVMEILKAREEKGGKICQPLELPDWDGSNVKEMTRNVDIRTVAKNRDLTNEMRLTADNQVSFIAATRQVLKLTCTSMRNLEENMRKSTMEELDRCDEMMSQKDRAKLQHIEQKSLKGGEQDVVTTFAIHKIQDRVRQVQAARKTRRGATAGAETAEPDSAKNTAGSPEDGQSGAGAPPRGASSEDLNPAAAIGEAVRSAAEASGDHAGLKPPRAG